MSYDNPFTDSSDNEGKQSWSSALIYLIGALLMLLLGFMGNGVL